LEYHKSNRTNGTIIVRVMCAVVFMLFSFCWLYAFQCDVLTVTQHVLSHGQTSYDRTIGAVIITLILQLVQLMTCAIVRLYKRTHALTYMPSMLLLAWLCSYKVDAEGRFFFGFSLWLFIVLFIVWIFVVVLCRKMMPYGLDNKNSTGLFSRSMWVNLLQMLAMMLLVAWLSNTDAVFHYRARAEVSLLDGRSDDALRVGKRSMETDENLTMLRVFALAQQHELGDRLFEYALAGTSNDLLPEMKGGHSKLLLLPADSIWKTIGGRPATPMTTVHFLGLLVKRDSVERPMAGEYHLCASLVDRQLDEFARLLPIYYNKVSEDSLPKYYREAIFLQRHLKHQETSDSLMLQQWSQYQQQSAKMTPVQIYSNFGKTYWYYYYQSR